MLVIVPLVCFACFMVTYAVMSDELGVLTRWRISFLAAAVTWGLTLTAITEVLSLFRLITFEGVMGSWMGVTLLSAVICAAVSRREKLILLLRFPTIPQFEFWCLSGVAAIALMVGLVAFVAPPNNADSMIYHMARVVHWIQNQTVAHYPTNILHQLFFPPWAEFAILHLQILSGGDQWSNLIQWFSMVGSIIGVSLIARQLGADIHGQVLAVVIVATIPMGILQASSTQNDYVTAFWLVSLMYYLLRFKMQPDWAYAVGVGASLALALLTKATAYVYALPMLAWFTFSTLRNLRWKSWQPLLLICTIVLSVNLGYYARNFDLWGNPLGIDQENPLANKVFGARTIVSNVIRNMSLHIGTRSLDINEAIRARIQFLHTLIGIDVNDNRTTLGGGFEQNWFSNHEDRASSPVHFMLIILSTALLFVSYERRRASDLIFCTIVLVIAFLVFCLYLKWQIWHARLHLPLFVLWSPVISLIFIRRANRIVTFLVGVILAIGLAIYSSHYTIILMTLILILCLGFKWKPYDEPDHVSAILIACFLIAASTSYVFQNQTRPLIPINTKRTILNSTRIDQLFIYHRYHSLISIYYDVARFINDQKCSNIGLVTDIFGLEYPFWVILQKIGHTSIHIEHVNVTNISAVKSRLNPFAVFSPCAIIAVEVGHNTRPIPERSMYVKAWTSDPRSVSSWREDLQVSVFTRRQDVPESR